MPMPSLADEKIGATTVRIVHAKGGGYHGVLIRPGKPMSETYSDIDLTALRARLRNEAGKLHPDYIGMDGAIARFRHFFPGGFTDRAYVSNERAYKLKARGPLVEHLPLDQALEAGPDEALAARKALRTNLLHSTESARLHETLGSPEGPAYVRAAARFTIGEHTAGLAGMAAALAPHGRSSWPLVTYFPYLWRPEEHMFLKPEVTRDFAERTGHPFQFAYAPTLDAGVYQALLVMVADTERAVQALRPVDRIDVQGFIWTVGSYTDADMPLLEKLRASG